MGIFKLVKSTEGNVRAHNNCYSIKNYLTKDFSKDFSLAVSELVDGKHELTKSVTSDRIYYFIYADAKFNVNGEEIKISNEDIWVIKKIHYILLKETLKHYLLIFLFLEWKMIEVKNNFKSI